eukprot:3822173-Alexandrium_andersonii.AAC.1
MGRSLRALILRVRLGPRLPRRRVLPRVSPRLRTHLEVAGRWASMTLHTLTTSNVVTYAWRL